MSEHAVFGAYAGFYDALYADKDYEAECDFLEAVFAECGVGPGASVLDLGCGTGGHVVPLARRGYDVTGVDRSASMVDRAQSKAGEADTLAGFVIADIRALELGRTFDAVISMFAVVSYQLTDADVSSVFSSARRHLATGGVFVFDVWHGPAVLTQRPEVKTKTVAAPGGDEITRTAHPTLDEDARTVEVVYDVVRTSAGVVVEHTSEAHIVRYFFADELRALLSEAGFGDITIGPFGEPDREPTVDDWNISVVARAL